MTDRDKWLIRNRTTEFLIFIGQVGQQIARHNAIREDNAILVPVMLEQLYSGTVH